MATGNQKLIGAGFREWKRFLTVVFFIAGNAIGASVLGLPIAMREAGFIPACTVCLFMSLVMAWAELLLARMFMESGSSDLPGMFKSKLGHAGGVVFNCCYFILFFCLLVAYWTGTRAILNAFSLGSWSLWATIFAVGCCLCLGFRVAGPLNTLLTTCMALAFLYLGWETFATAGGNFLGAMNFRAATAALPIVVCSYCFHGAIPLICRQLNCDRKMIDAAIITGVVLPLMFNIAILFIGFRVLSPQELAEGAANGWPLFVALENKLSSRVFFVTGNLFSIFAILSSLVGVTTTMKGALADAINVGNKMLFPLEFAVILLLPLAIAILCPQIFIGTLEFSGGILSNLMVGILPALALIRGRIMDWKRSILLAIFLWIFGLEIIKLFTN
ncbi:MAG: hypothetical protein LBI56_01370 [Puniceicoccales bacterium]|jgi:tyrosine-specific transport protein|nr:hypothetical protein [Puniceicoccales bacterium]